MIQTNAPASAEEAAREWFESGTEERKALGERFGGACIHSLAVFLTTRDAAVRASALEEARDLARSYPADRHGHLSVTPHQAAAQAADEIASAIDALSPAPQPQEGEDATSA